MTYKLICTVRKEYRITGKKWLKSINDHQLPLEITGEFAPEKSDPDVEMKYRGKPVKNFRSAYDNNGAQLRGIFTFETDDSETNIGAVNAFAIALAAFTDGIITNADTKEKWKTKTQLAQFLETAGGIPSEAADYCITRRKRKISELPAQILGSEFYKSHLQSGGFKPLKGKRVGVRYEKDFGNFVQSITLLQREEKPKGYTLRVRAAVDLDPLVKEEKIHSFTSAIGEDIQFSVENFPCPGSRKRWPTFLYDNKENMKRIRQTLPLMLGRLEQLSSLEAIANHIEKTKDLRTPVTEYKLGRIYEKLGNEKKAAMWFDTTVKKCDDDSRNLAWVKKIRRLAEEHLS